jgi:glutamyl-tRNA reductase
MTPMAEPPRLVLVGITHHTAPLELRERLALSAERQSALVHRLRTAAGAAECLLLNTCNRIEIYAVGEDSQLAHAAVQEFCAAHGIAPADVAASGVRLLDGDAVLHLFEVSAGLDSQMVGETEILGQVKESYDAARRAGSIGPVLNRVCQKAFQSAKLVRSETAIGAGQVSVASRTLVLGAGDIAEKTLKALRSREAGAVALANRTRDRAAALAAEIDGATVLEFEGIGPHLHEFDIVIASTSAPDVVLTLPTIYGAMRRRPTRPLFLIDLALPRDIDPGAVNLPNVFLYNLDDLARIADENIALRRAEIERARALLVERAATVWRRLGGDAADSPALRPALR